VLVQLRPQYDAARVGTLHLLVDVTFKKQVLFYLHLNIFIHFIVSCYFHNTVVCGERVQPEFNQNAELNQHTVT